MKAWEYEYQSYHKARPANFEENPSDWSGIDGVLQARQIQLSFFWKSQVPGSRAPESLYNAMVQAWFNRGYDVSEAEQYLDAARSAHAQGRHGELERLSGKILKCLMEAQVNPEHPSWQFARPEGWDNVYAALPAVKKGAGLSDAQKPCAKIAEIPQFPQKVLGGWQAQIAGGSYGTALEGYTGKVLREVYGNALDYYVKEPETLNDDITFELAALKAVERLVEQGRSAAARPERLKASDIADMWLEYIPFGWSAEHFALENLRRGLYPPVSGSFGNFFSEWIGAQMRTMVWGYLAPGNPLKAAEYAWMDSSVSHSGNGIYAGMHSAVLSSLAFVMDNCRDILSASRNYVPDGSEFAFLFDKAMESVQRHNNHIDSWNALEELRQTYNWIHAYPNMMAVVHGLWYCNNDLGRCFRILAECGADVDCNAGEAGSVLGVLKGVPQRWMEPFGNILETYVPGMEKMKITDLADWTVSLAAGLESAAGR